jgi:hypothetical protein
MLRALVGGHHTRSVSCSWPVDLGLYIHEERIDSEVVFIESLVFLPYEPRKFRIREELWCDE